MQNLDDMLKKVQQSGKADTLKSIVDTPEGQSVKKMIDSQAVENALASGDTDALMNIMKKVLTTKEGKQLAENISKVMEDK